MVKIHAEVSPSKFPQIEKCACYTSDGGGERAEKGTDTHDILEALFTGGNIADDADPDSVERATWGYNEIVRDVVARGGSLTEISSEGKVDILDENFAVVSFGWMDARWRGVVYDYKDGEIRDYSGQMMGYALGVMQELNLQECDTVIVYGRYRRVFRWIFTRVECEEYVRETLARAKDPDRYPEINVYCSWCAAFKTCPEVVLRVGAVVPSISTMTGEDYGALMKKPLGEITSGELSLLVGIAGIAVKWGEAVRTYCKDEMTKGRIVPGWKLRPSKGAVFIKDMQGAMEASGLPPAEFLGCCKAGIGNLAKAVKKQIGGSDDKAKKELLERIQAFTGIGAGSVSMVAE